MEGIKKNYVYIGKGVLRSCIATVALALVLALVQTYGSISEGLLSLCILMTSMISIIYGCIYATRKVNNKGWLVGILVSLFYMVILYITSLSLGKTILEISDIWRFGLALVTGTLSGMLGINL